MIVSVQLFIAYLMVPTAFFAVAFAFGLLGDGGSEGIWIFGGTLLGLVAYWFTLFLRESWIEDLVKSIFVGVLLIAALKYPETAALTLGLLTGFLVSALTKFFLNEIPHRRAVRQRESIERKRFERRRQRSHERANRQKNGTDEN